VNNFNPTDLYIDEGVYDSELARGIRAPITYLYKNLDLILLLTRHDFSGRYKRHKLGLWWSILTPTLTSSILYFVLKSVFDLKTLNGSGYATFLICGFLTMNLLIQGSTSTGTSFMSNSGIITKIRIDLLVFPIVSSLSAYFTFLLGFIPLLAISTFEMKSINSLILFVPLFGLFLTLFSLGIGILIAVYSAKYRDLQPIMSVFFNLLNFATPVIYPLSIVSGVKLNILMLNPCTEYVEVLRALVVKDYGFPELNWIIYSAIFTILILAIALKKLNTSKSKIVRYL
jgi:lipopolysaccharide transport system permease protein